MSNANRDYVIVYDVKNSSLVLSRPLIFYITDKNTSNIFVKLVTKVSVENGIDRYTDIENASNYVLTMRVIKPSNEVKSLEATQHEEGSIFQFDLTEGFKDIPGKYICELTISTIVNSRQELITSDPFNYEVKRSILSNVGEIIETENTTVEKLLNDLDATKAELSSQIKDIVEKQYVSYEDFGAKLDGLSDDFEPIKKAHDFANLHNIPVKQKKGKIYFKGSVNVETDVDLNGAEIIVNDTIKGNTLYVIKSENEWKEVSNFEQTQLKKGNTIIPTFSNFPNSLIYIDSDLLYGYRGGNTKDAWYRREMITHTRDGNISSGELLNDFDTGNLKIKTRTIDKKNIVFNMPTINYQITDVNETTTIVRCTHDNVTISNLNILIENEELVQGNSSFKGQLLNFEKCYNIKISDIVGSNITGGTSNYNSGYVFCCYFVNKLFLDNINLTSSGWGVMGTHYIKDFFIKNSTVNRVDCHIDLYNMTIENCNLHHSGVTIPSGNGIVNITNTTIFYDKWRTYENIFIFRTDFGQAFEGNVNIKDCKIVNNTNEEIKIIDIWSIENTNNTRKLIVGNITLKNIMIATNKKVSLLKLEPNLAGKDVYLSDFINFENIYLNSGDNDERYIDCIFLKAEKVKILSKTNIILKSINNQPYSKSISGYTSNELVNGGYIENVVRKKNLFYLDNAADVAGKKINIVIDKCNGSLFVKNKGSIINISNSFIHCLNIGDNDTHRIESAVIDCSSIVGYPTLYAEPTNTTIHGKNCILRNNILIPLKRDGQTLELLFASDPSISLFNFIKSSLAHSSGTTNKAKYFIGQDYNQPTV